MIWKIILQKILLMKSMNNLGLNFTMKKYHSWVKIFLKHIQVGDYSLTERQTIKVTVLEQSWYQNPVSTIPRQLNSNLIAQTTWLNTKLVSLV